jgi:hypothetical protein
VILELLLDLTGTLTPFTSTVEAGKKLDPEMETEATPPSREMLGTTSPEIAGWGY